MQDVLQRLGFPVPAEVAARLQAYEALLRKWQKAVNLVSPSTIDDIWTRHFLDSAQLFSLIPDKDIVLADMGAGAGFPGMVLAIFGIKNVHLIESDGKKCAFLENVSRETLTPVTIHNTRIEAARLPPVGLATARALAPLSDLIEMMGLLGAKSGLFLKGMKYQEEIEQAAKNHAFSPTLHPSLTDPAARIIGVTL